MKQRALRKAMRRYLRCVHMLGPFFDCHSWKTFFVGGKIFSNRATLVKIMTLSDYRRKMYRRFMNISIDVLGFIYMLYVAKNTP